MGDVVVVVEWFELGLIGDDDGGWFLVVVSIIGGEGSSLKRTPPFLCNRKCCNVSSECCFSAIVAHTGEISLTEIRSGNSRGGSRKDDATPLIN